MKDPKRKPSNVIFLRGIPPQLKNAFKAYCSLRGMSMKQAFVKYMQDIIRQDGRDL